MATRESDSFGPQKSTPSIQRVLDLTEERNRRRAAAKAERQRKFGRRHQYRHLDSRKWRQAFDVGTVLRFMVRLGSQVRNDDPFGFRTGGIGLTDRERRILEAMLLWRIERVPRKLSPTLIVNLTDIRKQHVFQTLHRLGDATIIVNLAGNSAPDLAPNPHLEFWDLPRLKELRKNGGTANPFGRGGNPPQDL